MSKRASRRDGWQTISYACRGVNASGRYKTFLATSQVVGGVVRVVLLEHASGNWAAYISTDMSMSVATILKTVSDRWSIEEHFHDVKEIWGAGQQQVRNVCRASVVGTCAVGCTRWWNWNVGLRRATPWWTAATDPGTIRTDDRHTEIVVAELPVKCCVRHF